MKTTKLSRLGPFPDLPPVPPQCVIILLSDLAPAGGGVPTIGMAVPNAFVPIGLTPSFRAVVWVVDRLFTSPRSLVLDGTRSDRVSVLTATMSAVKSNVVVVAVPMENVTVKASAIGNRKSRA